MRTANLTVAVIGGGPAGAVCAWRLARGGLRVLLYERDPDREKPCGGGLTGRAFAALPELHELQLPWNEVRHWRMICQGGREIGLDLEPPLFVVPRRELDRALRREAVKAGAALIREPVREVKPLVGGGWQINDHAADIAVGAAGMQDPLAKYLGGKFVRGEMAFTMGRYIPGKFAPEIITCFFPEQHGYLWWFPRPDHASFGMELPAERFDPEFVRRTMREFAARYLPGVEVESGKPYGWTAPAIRDWSPEARRFAGADWLLVGDAAGLCDVTTGEGISYALASGVLAADAIRQGVLQAYELRLRLEVIPELAKAARMQSKFYRPRLLNLAMWFLGRSRSLRRISGDLAHGRQSYVTLKRRTYRELPRILWEGLSGR